MPGAKEHADSRLIAALFEQAPVAMLVLDPNGGVVSLNATALARLSGASAERQVGRPIWDVVGHDAIGWWRKAIDHAMQGRTEVRDLDGMLGEGLVEWTVRPLRDPSGQVTGMVAEGRDVTEERQVEREAELLVRLAMTIGHTDSLDLAISATLRTVCEAAGWVTGEAWLPEQSSDTPRLLRGGLWTTRDPRVEAFAAQGTGFAFARGEGLPGTAWERGETVWEHRLTAPQAFTRAPLAAAAGLKAAVAIPVFSGNEIIAVLTFYMSDPRTDDARAARITTAVTAQLGPLIVQKQAEEAHRIAEAKLGGIVSIAVDAIISIDEQQRITLFNFGAERIFGYAADEMLGQPLDRLLPAPLRDRHKSHIAHFATSSQTARRMGERSPIVGLRKSGEVFPCEASISRFRAGGHWTFTVTLRDITDRTRTEEGLRFLAEAGGLLSDLIRDPTALERVARLAVPTLADVCVIDLADASQITTAAVAASDPVLGDLVRTARDRQPLIWESPDPVIEVLRDGVTCLDPNHGEARSAFGSLLVVPLKVLDHVLGAMSFVMARSGRRHDETYRTLAEQLAGRVALAVDGAALYQRTRQAVRARDEVLAVVSHDLRNPLSAISMCVSALRESPPDSETARELLGTVQESTALMSRIIQDLLDVASIDAGKLSIERRPQSLAPILAQAMAMFESVAVERQLTLSTGPVQPLAPVVIDADRILQVLGNLLHNACKFTPPGGTVHIEATTVSTAVEVTVFDTGPGIAPEDMPSVFDRFWHDRHSSKIRSTGLGLAIARGIVEAHGGRIWVESAPGQGAKFTFTLPLAAL